MFSDIEVHVSVGGKEKTNALSHLHGDGVDEMYAALVSEK